MFFIASVTIVAAFASAIFRIHRYLTAAKPPDIALFFAFHHPNSNKNPTVTPKRQPGHPTKAVVKLCIYQIATCVKIDTNYLMER